MVSCKNNAIQKFRCLHNIFFNQIGLFALDFETKLLLKIDCKSKIVKIFQIYYCFCLPPYIMLFHSKYSRRPCKTYFAEIQELYVRFSVRSSGKRRTQTTSNLVGSCLFIYVLSHGKVCAKFSF